MNPLAWLNPGRWLLYAALAGALVLGYVEWRSQEREIGRDEVRAEWARDREAQKDAALQDAFGNAKETHRRLERQQENQRAHDDQIRRLVADRDSARAAAAGLQHDVEAFRAAAVDASAGDPGAGQQCEAADAALGVLAHLLVRADERAGVLAEFADQAHAAGQQCERDYQALRIGP